MQVQATQGDTLDMLCQRHLGSTGSGLVETALALNPGLAQHGPYLPNGLSVTLPDATTTAIQPQPLSLWD